MPSPMTQTSIGALEMTLGRTSAAIAAAIVGAGLLAGCGESGDEDSAPPPARGACEVVLDVTGHPGPDWSWDALKGSIDSIQQACADRIVTSALITDYSKSSTCARVEEDTFVDVPNKYEDERKSAEAWKRFADKTRQLFLCGLYGDEAADPSNATPIDFEGSDIFSATQAAQESLSAIAGPRSLFIFSDMVNSMPPLRVPSDGSVEKQVTKLQEKGVVPDLQGVDVVVVGSGTSNEISPAKQSAIVRFWTAYFQAAGASSVKFQQTA